MARCIALGFATTVLVAWGSLFLEPLGRSAFDDAYGDKAVEFGISYRNDDWYWRGSRWAGVTGTWYSSYMMESYFIDGSVERSAAEILADIPELASNPPQPDGDYRTANARGWPMRAVWYEVRWSDVIGRYVAGGLRLPYDPQDNGDDLNVRAFGYLPLWRGLLIDTFVFGTFWIAVAWCFSRALASNRRRRGLCPHCAYALNGSTNGCPECGWLRTDPSV